MAKAAAPYLHPRLQSTTVSNPDGEELARISPQNGCIGLANLRYFLRIEVLLRLARKADEDRVYYGSVRI